jgi:hypothetical protein
MNNRESQAIFESYRQGRVVRHYLTEQEQQQAEVKQQVQQALETPEAQQAILKAAQEIVTKYKPQIDAAKAQDATSGGTQALDKLYQQIEAEIEQQTKTQAPAQVQKESLELQEGWFDRLRSRGAGAFRQGKELMRGGSQSTKGFDTHAVTKRFEILQNTIGKDLRELERDLPLTSDADKTVKDQVTQMIKTLGSQHNITPVQSKLGDVRHSIGAAVGKYGGAALVGAITTLAVGPIVAAAGITGGALVPATAGISGATASVVKDLMYGNKPDFKKAAITGVSSALFAWGLKWLIGNMSTGGTGGTQPEPSPVPTPAPSPTPSSTDLNQLFKIATTTDFNPKADIDVARMGVLKMLDQLNTEKGLGLSTTQLAKVFGDWSDLADAGKNASYEMVKNAVKDPESAQQITKLLARAGNLVQK